VLPGARRDPDGGSRCAGPGRVDTRLARRNVASATIAPRLWPCHSLALPSVSERPRALPFLAIPCRLRQMGYCIIENLFYNKTGCSLRSTNAPLHTAYITRL